MPGDKSKSPLAKKYGQKRVARARDLIKARSGQKLSSTDDSTLPWGLIGYIAKKQKSAGKTIKRAKIKKAQTTTKRKGVAKSLKRRYTKPTKL